MTKESNLSKCRALKTKSAFYTNDGRYVCLEIRQDSRNWLGDPTNGKLEFYGYIDDTHSAQNDLVTNNSFTSDSFVELLEWFIPHLREKPEETEGLTEERVKELIREATIDVK